MFNLKFSYGSDVIKHNQLGVIQLGDFTLSHLVRYNKRVRFILACMHSSADVIERQA